MNTRVLIIESERDWGSKVDEIKEFDTKEEAIKFVKDYNQKHNPVKDMTPNWYMYAKLQGDNSIGMMR